ncbi:MAG: HAD-superfamily hydrolase, subfamily IA, variant 3, partial [uncultured Corynebacteriales bacterium]
GADRRRDRLPAARRAVRRRRHPAGHQLPAHPGLVAGVPGHRPRRRRHVDAAPVDRDRQRGAGRAGARARRRGDRAGALPPVRRAERPGHRVPAGGRAARRLCRAGPDRGPGHQRQEEGPGLDGAGDRCRRGDHRRGHHLRRRGGGQAPPGPAGDRGPRPRAGPGPYGRRRRHRVGRQGGAGGRAAVRGDAVRRDRPGRAGGRRCGRGVRRPGRAAVRAGRVADRAPL